MSLKTQITILFPSYEYSYGLVLSASRQFRPFHADGNPPVIA